MDQTLLFGNQLDGNDQINKIAVEYFLNKQ